MSQTIPIRKGEELNVYKLESFLRKSFPELPEDPLRIEQFGTGASNLTYSLQVGDWEAVLRRPPHGPVAPKAHDMEREYFILKALNGLYPIAPKPYLFSDDTSIVGKPFFIMERKHGVLIDTSFPEGIKPTTELCQTISEEMVNKLVELHEVPYKGTILENISKPEGFLERQVHGWIKRYERSKTDEIPEANPLMKWLAKHIPTSPEATVIHYDYKLNNALFSEDLQEMVGLFDWEMTTVGDPLADLGVALCYWMEKDDPTSLKKIFDKPPITVEDGFYTRQQFLEAYEQKSGRDLTNIHFYLTFAYFKLAVILQQIYYRYKQGQTNDERFSKFGECVKGLIIQALHTARK